MLYTETQRMMKFGFAVAASFALLMTAFTPAFALANPGQGGGNAGGGNISCEQADFGQYFSTGNINFPNNGTFTENGVTFSWTINNDEKSLDWTATGGLVYAVIVKGGPAATVYPYSPDGSTFGNGLVAPGGAGISNIEFCYDPTVPSYQLVVEKTAVTTWVQTWVWDIAKVSDVLEEPVVLPKGEPATVNYTVTVSTVDAIASDFMVAGTITITNPAPFSVEITDLSDVMTRDGEDDVFPVVVCGELVTPVGYELASEETLNCTYTTELDAPETWLNTVMVEVTEIEGNTATAEVTFDLENPTTVLDECITVSDTNAKGPQDEEVCVGDLVEGEYSFPYAVTFGKDAEADEELVCGEQTYTNTAGFVTADTETEGSAELSIDMTVECPLFCSMSQGYWFARPQTEWGTNVGLGGVSYNRAAGLAVWNIGGRNNSHEAKRAFTQYAAIMLSLDMQGLDASDLPAELAPYLTTIENYFADNGGKTLSNATIGSFTKSKAVAQAAGFIGDWISANHCQ